VNDTVPAEVKAETVMRVLRGETRTRTAAEVLGVSEPRVTSWIRQYIRAGAQHLAGSAAGARSADAEHATQAEQLRAALEEATRELAVITDVLRLGTGHDHPE
jgi:transposase-like protein